MIIKGTIAIVLMAIITYIVRALPIALVQGQINNKFIKSFLFYVPYAVLASLTFPDIFYSTTHIISAVAGTFVAVLLAYCKRGLVIVATGAILTVFIIERLPFF